MQALADRDAETAKRYGEMRLEVMRGSDALGERVLTAAVVDQQPRTDLLASGMEKEWLTAGQVEHRLADGKLIVIGPAGSVGRGAVSTKQHWRDFVLELEFEIDRGKAEIYFRVQDKADSSQVPSITVGENAKVPASPGKRTSVTISVIGSKITSQIGEQKLEEGIGSRKSRHGVIAISPEARTAITFHSLRIRALR
jgi:hypothetical protein